MDQWSETTARTLFLILCALVALTGFWSNIQPYACPVPKALLPAETSIQPPCLEFWINRYQGLIGASIALLAAMIAIVPARGQLREMSKQTAATARQPMFEVANAFETELEMIRSMILLRWEIDALLHSYDNEEIGHLYTYWPEKWSELCVRILECARKLEKTERRYPKWDAISTARSDLTYLSFDLFNGMIELDRAFRSNTTSIDVENGEIEMNRTEIRDARNNVTDTITFWLENLLKLEGKLTENIAIAWREVRQLEAKAIRTHQ